ncbi:MAG: hypothetical protein ACLGP3_12520 [Acidobacteriota bacterium]
MEVGEEGFARADGLAGLLPEGFQAVQDGVEGEGQQVERGKGGSQMLLAVSEVVGQVAAVLLQHIEAFVLDLPTSSGTGGKLGHVVGRNPQAGHEGVAIGGQEAARFA